MFDKEAILKDSGAVTASGYGEVDSSAQVVNLGSGLVRGNVILDVSAIKISDKDEAYEIHLMGGNDESFNSEVSLCSKELGKGTVMQGNVDGKLGRYVLPFQNFERGIAYPYIRVRHVIAGTSPSINYTARMEKDLPVSGVTSTTQTATTTTTV